MHPYHNQSMGQGPDNSKKVVFKDFYVYQERFADLQSGQSATGNVNIQADSDFMLQKLTVFASIAGAAQTDSNRVIPLVTIQVTDSGSGRNLFEEAIPASAIFGTGELPFILPTPKLFAARSTITVNVSNFSAATDYRLDFSFIGYKVFRTGQ